MLTFKQFIIEDKKLEKHYKFGAYDQGILDSYTGSGYNHSDRPELDRITREHRTPRAITVHSGLSDDTRDSFLDQGETKSFSRPVSTSLDHKTASTFAHRDDNGNKHVLSINLPKGSKGIYIGSRTSRIGNEKEFLLPSDAKVKVHPTPKIKDGIVHWKGELVE